MNADTSIQQRIGRLTPLADVLAAITKVKPVPPQERALADALGCALATDILATHALPSAAVALRDGWAVASEATRDAGPYAPLALQPPPQRVDAFDALPAGTDAVAPLDALTMVGGMMQAMAPVAPGESVLPAGGDAETGSILCAAGSRLRGIDIAALAAGVTTVSVRQPRIRVVNVKHGAAILKATARMIARAAEAAGAKTEMAFDLDQAFGKNDTDAIIAIGGTGAGRNDSAVTALSRAGSVVCHGIGLAPGETSAYGHANGRPVLLMPGRIDAALASWLVLGRALLDRLSGAQASDSAIRATLARKVTSTVGIAEVILLARSGDAVEPLASGYLSLQALARADGWMLAPAESEGYPAGTQIDMRPLP